VHHATAEAPTLPYACEALFFNSNPAVTFG
jgi:hypothetical protein